MHKYSLSDYFDNWTRNKIFPSYFDWKRIVKSRIAAHENNAWTEYASMHQDIEILNKTFSCMTINEFWEIVDRTPDLAFKRNLQIRLMGNFGLQYGYRSLGVKRVYFVKTVTWKMFFISCLLPLNLKMNGLFFGIFSKKKFQILITLKRIYSFILLTTEINPQQLDFSSGAFLYRSIAVLRIFLTSLLLYPFGRSTGSDKT